MVSLVLKAFLFPSRWWGFGFMMTFILFLVPFPAVTGLSVLCVDILLPTRSADRPQKLSVSCAFSLIPEALGSLSLSETGSGLKRDVGWETDG